MCVVILSQNLGYKVITKLSYWENVYIIETKLLWTLDATTLYGAIPNYVNAAHIAGTLENHQTNSSEHHDQLNDIRPHYCLHSTNACVENTNYTNYWSD